MHKDSIRNSKKVGLLNLVKSPIGAESSFQIHQDAHELDNSSRKYNEGWKDNSYMLLLEEKDGGGFGKKTSQLHLV